jgi:uncharacterized peroxidase-related enzyme
MKALCEFAEKITQHPSSVQQGDVEQLRAHGLSDRDILDAVEAISYFNYINRVADALGIDPEPEMEEARRKWKARRGPSRPRQRS